MDRVVAEVGWRAQSGAAVEDRLDGLQEGGHEAEGGSAESCINPVPEPCL
jgi:hypothetical protein